MWSDFLYSVCLKHLSYWAYLSDIWSLWILFFTWSTLYSFQILIHRFSKNTQFHENLSSRSRPVPCGRTYKCNFVTPPKNGPVTATIDLLLLCIIIIIIIIIVTSTSAPKRTPHCIQNLPKSLNPKVNGLDHEDEKHMVPYLHCHFKTSCRGA